MKEKLTIQDLAMFIGCKVLVNDERGEFIGTLQITGIEGQCSANGYIFNNQDCKPILRPLSDMTEEEEEEIGLNKTYEKLGEEFSPEEFRYLISKHFDLFNWIESGLAINKTTNKR